jgi:predicted transcriptional regulator
MNVALNIDLFHLLYSKGLPMPKKLIEIASEIVQTQVSLTSMSANDIAVSLREVFSTLQELQKAEAEGIELALTAEATGEAPTEQKPMLTPQDSIQKDKVICLECGAEMKQLTSKHLVSHGMGQKEYRKKYGFSMRTPLSAKSLTKARSKAAKKRGLPEKLQQFIEARRQKKAATSTQGAKEAGVANKPKRTRLRKKKAV